MSKRSTTENKRRISIYALLQQLVTHSTTKTRSIGELVAALGDQAFGLIIICLALPSTLPIAIIPGLSFIFGLPIVLIALNIIFGRQSLWLPKRLAERRFKTAHFIAVLNKTLPYLKQVEKLLKPRWFFFTLPLVERFHGVVMLLLSLLLLLPIPLSNFVFSSLIILFGLGLAEKDGVVIFFAYLGTLFYSTFLISTTKGIINYLSG